MIRGSTVSGMLGSGFARKHRSTVLSYASPSGPWSPLSSSTSPRVHPALQRAGRSAVFAAGDRGRARV